MQWDSKWKAHFKSRSPRRLLGLHLSAYYVASVFLSFSVIVIGGNGFFSGVAVKEFQGHLGRTLSDLLE